MMIGRCFHRKQAERFERQPRLLKQLHKSVTLATPIYIVLSERETSVQTIVARLQTYVFCSQLLHTHQLACVAEFSTKEHQLLSRPKQQHRKYPGSVSTCASLGVSMMRNSIIQRFFTSPRSTSSTISSPIL